MRRNSAKRAISRFALNVVLHVKGRGTWSLLWVRGHRNQMPLLVMRSPRAVWEAYARK